MRSEVQAVIPSSNRKQEVRVTLKGLTQTNFLVGDNGSGKSRIIESIAKQDNVGFIRNSYDWRSWVNIDTSIAPIPFSKPDDVAFYEDHGIPLDMFNPDEAYWPDWIPPEERSHMYSWLHRFKPKKRGSLGQEKFWKLMLVLSYLGFAKNCDLFLIEEPEAHLHPHLQKEIPPFLELLHRRFGWQFLVSTHSPFIVSSSAMLTTSLEKEETPSQKVYFIKNYRIVNKRGNYSKKAEYGYWGSKCNEIASNMLGAGLQDLYSPQPSAPTAKAPYLVLCEGQGAGEDAVLYNIIFKQRTPSVLFVSARGSSQLLKSYKLLEQIQSGMSANVRIRMLRDRDHEFPKLRDMKSYEKNHYGVKILRRRALEAYLYSRETLSLVYKAHDRTLSIKRARAMARVEKQVAKSAAMGTPGHGYKSLLKSTFLKHLRPLELPNSYLSHIKTHITKLITPETKSYQELSDIIFS